MKAHVSDELDYKFKFSETADEQDAAENTPAMTPEEVRKVYKQAKTARGFMCLWWFGLKPAISEETGKERVDNTMPNI